MLFDLINAEQPVLLNSLDDGALAHAIATADFGGVGHAHGLVLALMADIAYGIFTKHQMIADLTDGVILTDLSEVPAAVCGVAVQAGSHQNVVLDHQLFVDPADRVAEGDDFSAFTAHKVACREQIDAGDLQFGRRDRALIAGKTQLCEVVGADLGLLEQWRHQAVSDAAMAGAFADGVNARVVGLQGVVDENAAIAGDARLLGKLGIGPNTGSHHHQICRDDLAVLELHRAHPAIASIVQGIGLFAQAKMQAACFKSILQQLAADRVELAIQQPFADMHHGHMHAAQHQAIGCLQPQQSAADDHRVFMGFGGIDHRLGIGNIAVADHTVQGVAGDRQDKGRRAGGNQQTVVLGFGTVFGDNPAPGPVDLHHLAVEQQLDVVVQVPVQIVEHYLLEGLFPGQNGREQDTVVVGVRFGAEDRNLVQLVAQFEQLFQGANPGHAVADHHQFEFFHQVLREQGRPSGGHCGLARHIVQKQKKASR